METNRQEGKLVKLPKIMIGRWLKKGANWAYDKLKDDLKKELLKWLLEQISKDAKLDEVSKAAARAIRTRLDDVAPPKQNGFLA